MKAKVDEIQVIIFSRIYKRIFLIISTKLKGEDNNSLLY